MPAASVNLSILCDNSVSRPLPVKAEHGFACLVETPATTILFDTGRSDILIENARILGKDLSAIESIVLSHGHYDHGGGLPAVLDAVGPRPVYAHPGIFTSRQSVGPETTREIGLPFNRVAVEEAGAQFILKRKFTTLAPGIHLTGEVPRVTDFEPGDPRLMTGAHPDPLSDDLSLVIETPRGPILLLGCAHAGLINILTCLRDQHNFNHWHAVIGGTHLGPVSEEQFARTVAALRGFAIERLCLSHCTGLLRAARLVNEFPGKVHFAAVGFEFSVEEA